MMACSALNFLISSHNKKKLAKWFAFTLALNSAAGRCDLMWLLSELLSYFRRNLTKWPERSLIVRVWRNWETRIETVSQHSPKYKLRFPWERKIWLLPQYLHCKFRPLTRSRHDNKSPSKQINFRLFEFSIWFAVLANHKW